MICEKKKILVVGDIMLDVIVQGSVERFAPNAYIPVLNIEQEKKQFGGAANVYNNILKMNIHCDLCGIIGNDSNGRYIINKVKEKSDEKFIKCLGNVTTTKIRFVANTGQEFLRVDNEEKKELADEEYTLLEKEIQENIDDYKIIIISDYNKGFLKASFIKNIIKIGNENNLKVIIDTKRKKLSIFEGCHILKANIYDVLAINKLIVNTSEEIYKYAIDLISLLNCKYVIMTSGENSIVLVDEKLKKYTFVPQSVTVVDTTGAGDVFISAVAAKLYEENDILSAIDYAKHMCSHAIQYLGTSVIEEKYNKKKYIDIDCIHNYIKEYRKEGKSIVFVNGCFDIIHAGHIDLLKQAKDRGDVLIVGLNSDESIRKLKGTSRPIIPEVQRVFLLESISYVDHIVLFSEDNPYKLIDIIKPDVVFKGAEYMMKDIPERKQINEYLGEISYCNYSYHISTSKIVDKIVQLSNVNKLDEQD